MKHQQSLKKLAKFVSYVLGTKPDEFGLIPDTNGFVKIKDLLKAVNEEEGWRNIRRAGINEVMISLPNSPIEIKDNLIRAKNRENIPKPVPAENLPKLLYTCLRQKAHPVVLDKGIFPLGASPDVVLFSEKKLALRIGKRIDQSPLLLTIQVQWSQQMGVEFKQFGKSLFLARSIPVGGFTAPPLPKDKTDDLKKEIKKQEPKPKTPGSYFPEFISPEEKKRERHKKRKKDMQRDKEKRMQRKQKIQSRNDF